MTEPRTPLPRTPLRRFSSTLPMARVDSLLLDATLKLREAGVVEARRDAVLLLAHTLDTVGWKLLLEPEREVDEEARRRFEELLERRRHREPVAYILGVKEFWGLEFTVGPSVLVPRPETEGILEAARDRWPREAPLQFLDVGTGSGCIAVSLLREFPESSAVATDVSQEALELAEDNARRHDVADRLELRAGAGFEPVEDLKGSLDLIVSNPPYVREDEWAGLQPEIRRHEPNGALVSGPSGLEMLEELCRGAAAWLRAEGWMLLEVGAGQGEAVGRLLDSSWRVEVLPDLAGIGRVVAAQRGAAPSEGRVP